MSETIIVIDGEELVVSLARENGRTVVTDGDRRDEIEILGVRGDEAELLINGRRRLVPFYLEGDSVHFHLGGETITATVEAKARAARNRHKEHSMTAPMPGVILELNSVALSTGIKFVSIAPGTTVTRTGHYSVPITLTFQGNYYDLTDFLFRLRNLVDVRDGELSNQMDRAPHLINICGAAVARVADLGVRQHERRRGGAQRGPHR